MKPYRQRALPTALCRRYTLIEVLASMGIFVILMMVLLQFFSAARKLWVTSSHRNNLYADARVALDMISTDLQNAMYQNDDSSRGIYPFWYRERVPATTGVPAVDELNFISKTDLKPFGANSDICEIRYTYVAGSGPIVKDMDNNIIKEGWLVRSCVGDNDTIGRYNFADYSLSTSDADRLKNIWSDSDDRYTPVIPGVVSMDIVCYRDVENTFPPLQDSELNDSVSYTDSTGTTNSYPKGQVGSMFPRIVKITLKLMDRDNWKIYMKYRRLWTKLTDAGKTAAAAKVADDIRSLRKRVVRVFSKTIYLDKRQST